MSDNLSPDSLPEGFTFVDLTAKPAVQESRESARQAEGRSVRLSALSSAVQVTDTPDAALEAADRFLAYIIGDQVE